MNRQKDLQYASRAASHIMRQKQIHRLRHVIAELAGKLPPEAQSDPEVRSWPPMAAARVMHVVRLLAPRLDRRTTPRTSISAAPASARAGRQAWSTRAGRWRPGRGSRHADPLEGFVLHELRREAMPVAG